MSRKKESGTSPSSEPRRHRYPVGVPGCECGSRKIAVHHYRSGDRLYLLFRCEDCEREWSAELIDANLSEPVTTDEVLSVHEFFAQFDRPLRELLNEQE